jgi:hypothetical protein
MIRYAPAERNGGERHGHYVDTAKHIKAAKGAPAEVA